MIYLIHKKNKVQKVLNDSFNELPFNGKKTITNTLYDLAKNYPDELLIWCYQDYLDFINKDNINTIFHHKCILASYNVNSKNYIQEQIGFVDQSIYLKVNKSKTYSTWLMSSDIGGVDASLLNTVFSNFKPYKDFDYFLNSVSKIAMPQGLFCYSEPKLFVKKPESKAYKQTSVYQLFRFVKTHYKWFWTYILFFCFIVYLKRFPLLPFLNTVFYKKLNLDIDFASIPVESIKKVVTNREIDVIIPTIGRKKYLYNVLKDLSKQTVLPKNVIIVEQNPDELSKSELDYLVSESWPFKIKHRFIHQTGVCNARNLALSMVESEWTLLGDDDNRFELDLIESIFREVKKTGVRVGITVYLKPEEKLKYFSIAQTPVFGGGNSFMKSSLIEHVKFSEQYEHNYGEDIDFGMQLRNLGEDVVYYSNIQITHLKAPIGGYRIKVKHPWSDADILPKPAPTIMLFNLNYFTKSQVQAYRLLLYIKFYKHQTIKNPFRYVSIMNKKWNASLIWTKKMQANA